LSPGNFLKDRKQRTALGSGRLTAGKWRERLDFAGQNQAVNKS
jgi:hypothetical protein